MLCFKSDFILDSIQYIWVSNNNGCNDAFAVIRWSANQVIGEPKVYPRYGDIQGSWASRSCTANEFLEVRYMYNTRINSTILTKSLGGIS